MPNPQTIVIHASFTWSSLSLLHAPTNTTQDHLLNQFLEPKDLDRQALV